MVDKIQKSLNKLSEKDRALVKQVFTAIENSQVVGLDVKKLKGHDDIFRVRKGKIRIVYRIHNGELYILAIERRNDTTYNAF